MALQHDDRAILTGQENAGAAGTGVLSHRAPSEHGQHERSAPGTSGYHARSSVVSNK
jgi:hypothetical protein